MNRPLVVALAFAVAMMAGCTAPPAAEQEPLQESSDSTMTTTTTATTPPSHPQPAPAAPSPTPPPPAAAPTPATPPPPTPTPPTSAPPKPTSVHKEESGWVNTTPGEMRFVAKMPLQIFVGAKNVTLSASVQTKVDPIGVSPAQVADFTIALLDPEGKTVKSLAYEPSVVPGAPTLTLDLNATSINKTGDYVFVLTVNNGASDGATTGQAYAMSADVKY